MTKPTLNEHDFRRAAAALNCEIAAIKAVCEVEAPKGGFLADGQPTILFERHKFSQFTKGRYDRTHPDISNPTPGGYGASGQHQHNKLSKASKLDRNAALKSASWGKFQIMGFNHAAAGHPALQGFVNAMYESEAKQLDAFVAFIQSQGLGVYLQRRDWAGFARRYNGPNYAINKYDLKMAAAYETFV